MLSWIFQLAICSPFCYFWRLTKMCPPQPRLPPSLLSPPCLRLSLQGPTADWLSSQKRSTMSSSSHKIMVKNTYIKPSTKSQVESYGPINFSVDSPTYLTLKAFVHSPKSPRKTSCNVSSSVSRCWWCPCQESSPSPSFQVGIKDGLYQV